MIESQGHSTALRPLSSEILDRRLINQCAGSITGRMARPEDLAPDTIADKSGATIEAALNLPPQDPPTNPKPGDVWVGKEDNPGLFVVMHGGKQLVLK